MAPMATIIKSSLYTNMYVHINIDFGNSDTRILTNIGYFKGAHIKISKILHVGGPDLQRWLKGERLVDLLWPVDLTFCSTSLHRFGQHHYGP